MLLTSTNAYHAETCDSVPNASYSEIVTETKQTHTHLLPADAGRGRGFIEFDFEKTPCFPIFYRIIYPAE